MARRNLDKILVIDIESTCWKTKPPPGQVSEIIEIGLCLLDLNTLERESKESILIKPVHSFISPFCTELTTLTPEDFINAISLEEAFKILKKKYLSKTRTWASWGDYDRTQFDKSCIRAGLTYPFGVTHLNIKNLYATSLGLKYELGLDAAYEKLGWEMDGIHHRGHDDAWNMARILGEIFRKMRE